MPTKRITVAIFLCMGMASIFSECKKGGILGGCHQSFAFTIDAKVYPDLDTVSLGDTIYIEVNVPVTLTDSVSGEVANLKGGYFIGTDMGFDKLVIDSPVILQNAAENFDLNLIYGKELSTSPAPDGAKIYTFNEIGNQFKFKLAIIPKKDTGVFTFSLAPASGVEEKNSNCPTFTLNYLLRNTTDQHYYLYPPSAGLPPAVADYYFYVKP